MLLLMLFPKMFIVIAVVLVGLLLLLSVFQELFLLLSISTIRQFFFIVQNICNRKLTSLTFWTKFSGNSPMLDKRTDRHIHPYIHNKISKIQGYKSFFYKVNSSICCGCCCCHCCQTGVVSHLLATPQFPTTKCCIYVFEHFMRSSTTSPNVGQKRFLTRFMFKVRVITRPNFCYVCGKWHHVHQCGQIS